MGAINNLGADDRARTGDLHLGKVSLYQLSYIRRTVQHSKPPLACSQQ